jgi:hypothetical protein
MALLAFGVALQGAVPPAMRVCAMHATAHGTAEALEEASGAADAHGGPTYGQPAHAPHAHGDPTPAHDTHEHHASAPDHAPDPAPAHPCDCVSDCCGVPAAVLTFAHAPLAASVRPVDTVGHNNPAPPRTAPTDRLLPFANGPPPHALG